ncbi:peptide-N4-(N-acetyl-beta- glucosaminyl)asparagine amidase [Blyttiomyces sp. JEL0837]|nr:peptide-N4-(N-acetyl-beta- glucosaminyl)asparagine amidase [Blyttiomyces sp. JEL0837]
MLAKLDGKELFSLKTGLASCTSVGTAKLESAENGPLIQLTENKNDQLGAIWTKEKISLTTSFISTFSFKITRPNGGDGADGISFVIQSSSPSAIGTGGSGLGYAGIPKSVAVEFDTYCSRDTCNDPNGNHISVHTRGELPNSSHHRFSVACTCAVPELASGRVIFVKVCYDYKMKSVEVWVAEGLSEGVVMEDKDFAKVLKVQMDFDDRIKSESAYFGFTGATGGLCQRQEILSWNIYEMKD